MIVKTQSGFGLVEALIALAIFLVVSTGAYEHLRQTLNTEARIAKSLKKIAELSEKLEKTKHTLLTQGQHGECAVTTENNYIKVYQCSIDNEQFNFQIFKR